MTTITIPRETFDAMREALRQLRQNPALKYEHAFIAAVLAAGQQALDQAQGLAVAWDEGYAAGVNDERISESNIGVAGFDAKVNPARENPYRRAHPQATEPAPSTAVEWADWDARGMLASKLKCWHRLTEEESNELAALLSTSMTTQRGRSEAAISLQDAWLYFTGAEPSLSRLGQAIDHAAALLSAPALQAAAMPVGELTEKVVNLPIPASAADLKSDIAELIQSHKYKGLRSIEVLGVFQFIGAEIISGSNS